MVSGEFSIKKFVQGQSKDPTYAQVPLGATKQEVVDKLGWPKSTSGSDEREILNYPDFYVLLVDGRVEKLEFKPAPPNSRSGYSAPAPKVTPRKIVQPSVSSPERISVPRQSRAVDPMPTDVQTAPMAPPKRVPAPVTASAPPSNPFPSVLPPFFWIVVILGILAGLKIRSRANRPATNRKVDIFSMPVRRSGHGLPPIIQRPGAIARPDPLPAGWSLALLREIEWHRFEHVVAAYERELGNDAELTGFGPDGGIDVRVFEQGSRTPERVIQCKAYESQIGVEMIRAFYGALTLEKAPKGAFYTTSSFSDAALAIGQANDNLDLVDGPTFLNRIQRLTLPAQLRLFEVATEGDYTTPTCPNCGVKMVLRTARRGRNAGNNFWACAVPRCDHIINLRRT